MTHQFNPTILREYDIRGIVGETLSEADAYALGRTFAARGLEEGARRIAVGRDGRTHSGMLEAALVRGLTHAAYHVGQILYLARLLRPDGPWLTVPPGQSVAVRGAYLRPRG